MSELDTNSTNIVIRDATVGDVCFVVACNAAMATETEGKTLDRCALEKGIAAVLAQPSRGFYLIAQHASVAVGCLLVTREWSDWRNGDWWWLQSVYVVPEARRRGVFRALHAVVDQRARAASEVIGFRLYVERENAEAQATYVALGMSRTGYRLYERGFAND